jgi:hypothetical protein
VPPAGSITDNAGNVWSIQFSTNFVLRNNSASAGGNQSALGLSWDGTTLSMIQAGTGYTKIWNGTTWVNQ